MMNEQTFKNLTAFFRKHNIILIDGDEIGNWKIPKGVTVDRAWLYDELVVDDPLAEML